MWHGTLVTEFVARVAHHALSFDALIVLATWVSALLGAALTYLNRHRAPATRSLRGFLAFCFPSTILRHPSCRLDLGYTVVKYLVQPIFVAPFLLGNAFFAEATYHGLAAAFGPQDAQPVGVPLWIAIVVAAILVQDFITFYIHYWEHRLKLLWELHKVHHSTEFLLPISNRRIHPWQEVIDAGSNMIGVGTLLGIASYAFHLPIQESSVVGIDAYFLAGLLSFYHLRHSHIDMSYGRLEKWIMSPAQHQLHHSQETRHWDMNFGLLLSVWDRAWGTLLYAEPTGSFRVGLPAQHAGEYDSVPKLYLRPVVGVARMLFWGEKPAGAPPAAAPETAQGAD